MRDFIADDGIIGETRTMYRGIHRLPPGHLLFFNGFETRIKRYWFPESIPINSKINLKQAAEQLREKLKNALYSHCARFGNIGCELSGGLDSSTIFALATQLKQRVTPYSLRFSRLNFSNENTYIDEVLHLYGKKGCSFECSDLDYSKQYTLAFNHQISPHWPLWTTFTFMQPLAEVMHQNGIQLVLTGQGGDHLLQGSKGTLHYLLSQGKLFSLAKEMAVMKKHKFKSLFVHGIIPWLSSAFRPYRNTDADIFLNKAFSMFMDTSYYRAMEQQFGIQAAHPFLDLHVVEFVLSLPLHYKYSKGIRKILLREAMKGVLPETVRMRRTKASFDELLLQQIHAIDLPDFWEMRYIVDLGLIEGGEIDRMIEMFAENNYLYPREIIRFWQMINLESWYRYRMQQG